MGFDKKENDSAMLGRKKNTADEDRDSLTDYGFPS